MVGHATVFQSRSRFKLAPTLKNLSLFEYFDAVIHGDIGACLPRPADPSLASALANASSRLENLENLAATFLIDATDFFRPFFPATWAESQQPDWKSFRTLALTANVMSPRNSSCQTGTKNLLEAAGKAALRMPMLQKLEIWNAKAGEGAIFQYERAGIITWSTSWPLKLDPGVIQVWDSVALEVAVRHLTVRAGSIIPPKIYGSILHMLELKEQMLHPVSLYQIQWEVENERG